MVKYEGIKPYLHSYSKYLLKEKNIEIYQGGNRILAPDNIYASVPGFFIKDKPLEPLVNFSELRDIPKSVRNINSYDEVKSKFRLVLNSYEARQRWYKLQRVVYKLEKIEKMGPNTLTNIPREHKVEWDIVNKRVRLTGLSAGPHRVGNWIYYSQKSDKTYAKNPGSSTDLVSIWKDFYGEESEEIELPKIRINEIPIMLSEGGELICIERKADQPVIGYVGSRGCGKSMSMHRMEDQAYWRWGNYVCHLNDKLQETKEWCLPINYSQTHKGVYENEFEKTLRKIGEEPRPLPMVYVYPNTDRLKSVVYEEEGVSIKISLPFREIIRNYGRFFKGKKEWEMPGATGKWFRLLEDELSKSESIKEVEELIYKTLNPETKKGVEGVAEKMFSIIDSVFREEILDINTKIGSKLTVVKSGIEKENYYPIPALMKARLVPSFITSNLVTKDYFPQYFKFIIDDIFNLQISDSYFSRNKAVIWVAVDELEGITQKGSGANESLSRLATEGRNNRIGLLYATQLYNKIPEQIRTNTTVLLTYRYNNSEIVNTIANDFDLGDSWKEEIKNLDKEKRECIIMTSDKLISYNLRDGGREKIDEVRKGIPLPPLSLHKKPLEGL